MLKFVFLLLVSVNALAFESDFNVKSEPLFVSAKSVEVVGDSNYSWSTQDTYRQLTFLAVYAADWAQTRNIARNPTKWYESTPSLGHHPTTSQVNKFFISMAALNTGIAYYAPYAIPEKYQDKYGRTLREAFQYLSIGYESAYVRRNLSIGIDVKF